MDRLVGQGIRRLGIAIVIAILTASMGSANTSSLATKPPGRVRCARLAEYESALRRDHDQVLTQNSGAASSAWELRVPVIIHIMERGVTRSVQKEWTADLVKAVFGPSATNEFSVNHVWATAGIRFDVERVEECFFSAPPPRTTKCESGTPGAPPDCVRVWIPDDPVKEWRATPEEMVSEEGTRGLLATNRWYGIPRKVNVYLWYSLEPAPASGYAESPRRRKVGAWQAFGWETIATLWLNRGCPGSFAGGHPRNCQLHVAHELGHTLGLEHICYVTPEGPQSVSLCDLPVLSCSKLPEYEGKLMKNGVKGPTLCPGEIASARAAVKEFF
jgi:hypothetical protein